MRIFLILLLFLSACTDSNKGEIISLLEKRDAVISQRDISSYSSLLSPAYLHGEGADKVSQMQAIFKQFDAVKMTSRDREISIIDGNRAICEQTYILKVLADNEWREIVQREQLSFELSDGSWKISGGL